MGKFNLRFLSLIFLAGFAFADQCQITSPLPVPVSIAGCTFSSALPSNSTSYIQNTLSPSTTSQLVSIAQLAVSSVTTHNGNVIISSTVVLSNGSGANGQVFTSGGPGTTPTWTNATGSGGVSAINSSGNQNITGNVTFQQGLNVTLSQSGSTITIASSGSGGGGSSSLATAFNGTQVSSPTPGINVLSPLVNQLVGSTPTFSVDLSTTLSASSATATYLQLSSASATYLQQSSATATYLQLSSATATYLKGNQTVTLSGDSSGSGTTAITVTATPLQSNITTFSSSITVGGFGGLGVGFGVTAGSYNFISGNNQSVLFTNGNAVANSSSFKWNGSTVVVLGGVTASTLAASAQLTSSSATLLTGNLSISSTVALGGSAGASGQYFGSNGPGTVPSWQTGNVGTITSVVAGIGLTGGGASGAVTLTAATTAAFTTSTQTWTAGQTHVSSVTFNGAVIVSTSISAGGVGTSGQFLTSGGPGASVSWTTASGSSGGVTVPSSFTWTGVIASSVQISGNGVYIVGTSSGNLFTASSATTGVQFISVSSTPAVLQSDFLLNVSSSSGVLTFGIQNNSHVISSGTTPSVSSCGTSPSMDPNSTDFAGTINTGSASPTACTLTFSTPFPNTPVCVVSDDLQTSEPAVTARSASAITLTLGASLSSGHIFYICVGQKG